MFDVLRNIVILSADLIQMNNSFNNNDRHQISSFIDKLLSPPSLFNPLRRSHSQKNISEAGDITPPPQLETLGLNKVLLPTPIKNRSRSEQKQSEIFSNTKHYAQPLQGSFLLSKISELQDAPFPSNVKKEVRFKQSIIHKNLHKKRQNLARTRTPSILKKSQLLRQATLQQMQAVNLTNALERQSSLAILSGEDRQTRAAKTNQVVKKRYFTIMQRFQAKFSTKIKKGMKIRNDQKYKDQLFPPITSSLFRGGASRPQQTRLDDVRWVRVPDLFKNRKLTIMPEGQSNLRIYCNRWRSCNNFIGDAFTCLKNYPSLLEKMFEIKQQCAFGIYLVKTFQENVWKYVIIDDFIPTYVDSQGNYVPIYLNIEQIKQNHQKPLEIWPFLLQKAYANYYANYQSLHYGNTLDFLQEITGTAGQTFQKSNKPSVMKQNIKRLTNYLSRQNIIALGYIEQQNVYMPLYRNQEKMLVTKRSHQATAQQAIINIDNIFQNFDKVHIIVPNKWIYSAVSTVGINVRRAPQQLPRFDISLRILKVTEPSQVNIAVRQKQKRFYQSSSLNYTYIWIRVIILQKQFEGDFRWHSARYLCTKTVSISDFFQPGEYYIIMLPQWKCSHCYQLSILVQATHPVSITRKQYDDKQRILQKGCADLAQRFGKLQQINLYACSYCIVQQQIGFILENINNQRFNGEIRINRSIGGIKSTVDLVPFNIQFYVQKVNKAPFRTQICVYIPADKSYTVILMTRGGLDTALLKRFDFTK